jgi:hypothetical protein
VLLDLPLNLQSIDEASLTIFGVWVDAKEVLRLVDRNGMDDRFRERVALTRSTNRSDKSAASAGGLWTFAFAALSLAGLAEALLRVSEPSAGPGSSGP